MKQIKGKNYEECGITSSLAERNKKDFNEMYLQLVTEYL